MLELLRKLFLQSQPARPAIRPKRRRQFGKHVTQANRSSGRQSRNGTTQRFQPRPAKDAHGGIIIALHGTPSLANVKSIMANGWVVGNGNGAGDGVYATTDTNLAKSYAGSGGYILKLGIKAGRIANWSPALDRAFQKWCTAQHCAADMSARTVFLLSQKYQTLRTGNVVVVLLKAYRNPVAAKIRTRRIRVISVSRATDGKEIDLRSLQGQ